MVFQDSAGPMCRTVTDAAKLLEVMVGFDPTDVDTATAAIAGRVKYVEKLDKSAMAGTRIGGVREIFGDVSDPNAVLVNTVIKQALATMTLAGATLVDVTIPDLQHYIALSSMYITRARYDIDRFLAARPNIPIQNLKEIITAEKYHPKLDFLEALAAEPDGPYADPDYYQRYRQGGIPAGSDQPDGSGANNSARLSNHPSSGAIKSGARCRKMAPARFCH